MGERNRRDLQRRSWLIVSSRLVMALFKLAHHMSYCLLHLHIQFHSHTQRCRHASDYFARVGCRSLNPSHYANGLRSLIYSPRASPNAFNPSSSSAAALRGVRRPGSLGQAVRG